MEWLIVGLGNPGKQYQNTRHNVGFMVVEEVARRLATLDWRLEKKFKAEVAVTGDMILVKPQTFMNCSGEAVRAVMNFYKLSAERVIVVHDDLDISQGSVKAGMEKGPKVHNGLTSIEQQLGTNHFWRVRVGIETRTPEERSMWPGEKYVLLPLSASAHEAVHEAVILAAQKVKGILDGTIKESV